MQDVPFDKGANCELDALPGIRNVDDYIKLFSESNSRYILEIAESSREAFERIFVQADVPFAAIGAVTSETRFQAVGADGELAFNCELSELKQRWQKPLDLGGEIE